MVFARGMARLEKNQQYRVDSLESANHPFDYHFFLPLLAYSDRGGGTRQAMQASLTLIPPTRAIRSCHSTTHPVGSASACFSLPKQAYSY